MEIASSIVALGTAAKVACKAVKIFHEIASKEGAEAIADDVKFFAAHISCFSFSVKTAHAHIRDHYDNYEDSDTIKQFVKDDILQNLAWQSKSVTKRLKTLAPHLKQDRDRLGFWGRCEWVLRGSNREALFVAMERVKTNFMIIQYQVMYEALQKRFGDSNSLPNKKIFGEIKRELREVKTQLKIQMKSLRTIIEKDESLNRGTLRESENVHNLQLKKVETSVLGIGERIVSETGSASSSGESMRESQSAVLSKSSSHNSRPSASHSPSERTVHLSTNAIPRRNFRHDANSDFQNASEAQEVHSRTQLVPPQDSSSQNTPYQVLRGTGESRIFEGSGASAQDNQIRHRNSPNSSNREKREGTQNADPLTHETENPEFPSVSRLNASKSRITNHMINIPVQKPKKLLRLDPAYNLTRTITVPIQVPIQVGATSHKMRITATLNSMFPGNIIARQLAQDLGLDIKYYNGDEPETEILIGNYSECRRLVIGTVSFRTVSTEADDPCIVFVCDYADGQSIPYPLVLGSEFDVSDSPTDSFHFIAVTNKTFKTDRR